MTLDDKVGARSGSSSKGISPGPSAATTPRPVRNSLLKQKATSLEDDKPDIHMSHGPVSLPAEVVAIISTPSSLSLNDSSDECDTLFDKFEATCSIPKHLHRSKSWDSAAALAESKDIDTETLYEFMGSLSPNFQKNLCISTIEEKSETTSLASFVSTEKGARETSVLDSPVYQRPRLSCIQTPRLEERSRSLSSRRRGERIYVEIPAYKRPASVGVQSKTSCPAIVQYPPTTPTPSVMRRERIQSKLESTKDVVKQIVAPLTKIGRSESKGDISKDLEDDVAVRRTHYEEIPYSEGGRRKSDAHATKELVSKDPQKIQWTEDSDEEICSPPLKSPASSRSMSLTKIVSPSHSSLNIRVTTPINVPGGKVAVTSQPPPPGPGPPATQRPLQSAVSLSASPSESEESPYTFAKDVNVSMDAEIVDSSPTMVRLQAEHPCFPSVPLDITVSVDPRSPAGKEAIASFQNMVLLSLQFTRCMLPSAHSPR